MAFEEFRTGIAMLLDEIAANPKDAHELQEQVREKLSEMRALGLPLPEDLVELEARLEQDLDEPEAIAGNGPGNADGPDEAGH